MITLNLDRNTLGNAMVLLFVFTGFQLAAQTYVNKEWVKTHSAPDSIDWSASTVDPWGQLITTGNTLANGYADMLITKFRDDGDIDWQVSWDGPKGKSDYGAAIATDDSGNVYVAGASHYSNDSIFDLVLLKYDPQGNLLWKEAYDGTGGSDYPLAMTLDIYRHIYITGASEGAGTGLDFVTLKYGPDSTFFWDARYDYNGYTDIAVDIVADQQGDYVTITGGSEDTAGSWDYTTVMYDVYGDEVGVDRESSDETDLSKPRDIVKDANGNYYITGMHHNGTDQDIKLIKLDSALGTKWVSTYNSGSNEGANALAMDDSNNLYIGGWKDEGPGLRYFLLLKYGPTGNLLWEQVVMPDEEKPLSEITHIKITSDGVINSVGVAANSFNSDIVTAGFDTSGRLEWMETWENMAGSIDYPTDIEQVGEDIYVSGRTAGSIGPQWVTIQYSLYHRELNYIYGTQDEPLYNARELIVRFDTSVVKQDAVDNLGDKEATFGELGYFLKESAVGAVQDAIAPHCFSGARTGADEDCPVTVLKIFRHAKTTEHTTTSRLGAQVRIPPFWATFVLVFPEEADLMAIADTLAALFPSIKYAQANRLATLASVPNDEYYEAWQAALHPTASYPNAHINIEPAWEYTTGDPSVRIGVYDHYLNWRHEDFGYDANDPGSTRVVDGWHLVQNVPLKSSNLDSTIFSYHGTAVGGIIGAVRNNDLVIAGVAGGDDSVGQRGVSLYSLVALPLDWAIVPFDYIASGIKEASMDDTSGGKFRYGLDIANYSWGIYEKDSMPIPWFTDTNITLLREAIHFAFKNNVTSVVSRHNQGENNRVYPANFYDDWVLCVGATGWDGNFADSTVPNTDHFTASSGWQIDVAAPGAADVVRTLGLYKGYTHFAGTSAAAPFVSGVAGLLMSYLNKPGNDPDNLAPEDVEYILQMTATDTDTANYPGVDSLTGHGRINAGAALQAVDKEFRRLNHYKNDTSSFTPWASISTNDTITIPEHFENHNGVWFQAGKYVVNTYEATKTVNHNIPQDDSIVAYWPRPGSSNVFLLFDADNILRPAEKVIIDSLNHSSAWLKGYIYEVEDTLGNSLGWWPIDPTHTNIQFAYSVLQHNVVYTGTNDPQDISTLEARVFPNPVSNQQQIEVFVKEPVDLSIQMYDIAGRLVSTVFFGKAYSGQQTYSSDLTGLPNGIYLYSIVAGNEVKTIKAIKH